NLRLVVALIPGELASRRVAARAVFINRRHRGRSDFRMRIWAERLNRLGCIELERPKWQIVPMAAEVRHRPVTKIPPTIPARAGEIGFVEGPMRRWTDPQIPVEVAGRSLGFSGPLGTEHFGPIRATDQPVNVLGFFGFLRRLPSPSPRNPYMGFTH